jgi:hypothetical protein
MLFSAYNHKSAIKVMLLIIDNKGLIEDKKNVIKLVGKWICCYYCQREIKFVVLKQIFVK